MRFRVNTALVAVHLLKLRFPEPAWALVHGDDRFAVVVRRAAVDRELHERIEYRHHKPLDPPQLTNSPVSFERFKYAISRNLRERQGLASKARLPNPIEDGSERLE